MVFSCTATPEPSNVPPRVLIEAVESDPDLSIQTVAFFRDGAPLRFEPAVTGDSAVAYDYDAPFDVALTYRADGTELGSPLDWTEDWASLADWSGSGWAVGSGVASSTSPGAILYRDTTTGTVLSLVVTLPSNLTLQLTDASDNVVVSVLVSPDGTVTLSGSTASKVTGSGTFTLSLSEDAVSIVGTGWSTSVGYAGDPTRVRLVAPAIAALEAEFSPPVSSDLEGIAFQSTGDFLVVDRPRARILRFDSAGAYVSEFGASGTGSGQMSVPYGIAVDASDNIWVVDAGNNKVLKFDPSGTFVAQYGSAGSGNGQFNVPVDIAFKSTGNFVVTDWNNNRVQEFNSSGTYQSKFTVTGAPRGVTIGASDDIIVVASSAHQVRRYNASGVLQDTFDNSGLLAPRYVTRDSAGSFYVTAFASESVHKYDTAGAFLGQFTATDVNGIRALATGDIYAASYDGTVKRFTTDPGSVDDLILRIALDEPVDVTATDTATLSPTGATAGAWLTNAATPDLAILAEAEPASSDDEFFIVTTTRESGQLAANSVSLPIEGSPDVLTVVLGPRFKETWTLDIACTTQAAYQTLTALMANSSVISLRFPATPRWVGLDGGFYAVGDITAERRGHPQLGPVIIASLPLLPARAPKFKPLWQWSWDTLVQTGMSWDDVAANFDSWNDVLVGPN